MAYGPEFPENAGVLNQIRAAADWLSQNERGPAAPPLSGERVAFFGEDPDDDDDDYDPERRRCLKACDGEAERRERYCRTLRNPRLRAGCWAVLHGTRIACRAWCRSNY